MDVSDFLDELELGDEFLDEFLDEVLDAPVVCDSCGDPMPVKDVSEIDRLMSEQLGDGEDICPACRRFH